MTVRYCSRTQPFAGHLVVLCDRIDYAFRRPELPSTKFTAASLIGGKTAAVYATSRNLRTNELSAVNHTSVRYGTSSQSHAHICCTSEADVARHHDDCAMRCFEFSQ